jgi:hypothetical protein
VTTYDLGDGVNLETLVYDRDHVLTSATVALTVTAPDGTTLQPGVTQPSTGRYRAATFVPDQLGIWAFAWSISGTVTDLVLGSFVVADPAPPVYADLTMVKSALGKLTADDRDELIERAISAASRWIDRRTGRRFYADRTATARTFPIVGQAGYRRSEQYLIVDDIASAQGLAVATGTAGSWSTVTGWSTGPDNALVYGRPITELYAAPGWLPASGRLQVTARWGWPTVPDDIAQAAQLLAARFYRRKDSPQGVLGSTEWGTARVSRTDPDVEALIAPFVIPVIA